MVEVDDTRPSSAVCLRNGERHLGAGENLAMSSRGLSTKFVFQPPLLLRPNVAAANCVEMQADIRLQRAARDRSFGDDQGQAGRHTHASLDDRNLGKARSAAGMALSTGNKAWGAYA